MAIMTRCCIPPESYERIGGHSLLSAGNIHLSKPVQGDFFGGFPWNILMKAQGLDHLVADSVQRRQGRHGFLKNHADGPAPYLTQPRHRCSEQVLSLEKRAS